eukprot:gb/GECH01001420.1/.p1 GENE.gb/GECH01001420.1/~~gb/GECH01001420.1/.p1  ORF type:complete len:265 (+),score=59.36 gb/GECH01001420.1/:1-795(+)
MSRSKIATGIFFGVPVGITFCLGVWQTQRYHWKVGLIEKHERKMKEKPVPLESLPELQDPNTTNEQFDQNVSNNEFIKVKTNGKFDHDNEQLLGLRKPPEQGFPTTESKKFGFYVITPLQTKAGQTLFVNRGWVPRDAVDKIKHPENECSLCGVLRKSEKKSIFHSNSDAMSSDKNQKFWLWLSSGNMLRHLGIHQNNALILDQVPCDPKQQPSFMRTENVYPKMKSQTDHGFAITPEKHAGYAVTWFGLASCIGLMGLKYMKK